MLTADTTHKLRALAATCRDSVLYETAHTLDVDGLEWICIENLVSEIVTHKCTYVVT